MIQFVPRKNVGRTTELRKLKEVIQKLDGRIIVTSPIEYDTTLFNQFGKGTVVLIFQPAEERGE